MRVERGLACSGSPSVSCSTSATLLSTRLHVYGRLQVEAANARTRGAGGGGGKQISEELGPDAGVGWGGAGLPLT